MTNRILTCIQCLFTLSVLQCLSIAAIAQQADSSKDSILYFSQFDSKEEAPSINHGDTAISKVENGNFVMNNKKSNRFWTLHLSSPDDLTVQAEILEVKLKISADSLPGVYGFSFNTQVIDKNKWDDFLFLLSTDKQFCIFTNKSGQSIPISGWQPNFYVNSTGYNLVRIEIRAGNFYHFYINNELVYQRKLQPVTLMLGALYTDPHSILSVEFLKVGVLKK
jgi:hypothetical protein